MTQKQYDTMYLEIQKLVAELQYLRDEVSRQSLSLDELQKKTLVVTSLDNDVENLKVEIESLKDEWRA